MTSSMVIRSLPEPKFSSLKPEEIAALTDEELAEYEEALEAEYWERGRDFIEAFANRMEVPGVPISEDESETFFPIKVTPAAHHKLILDSVQELADNPSGGYDGVMIFMPPGSAKSSYASVLTPAWLMGRKTCDVISTSYGDDLAVRFGRRVRTIVRSADFQRVMGTTIVGDNQAVNEWSLTNGSQYRASGLGGTITGIRADYMIIDDPFKNREEADSEVIREKRWQSYTDDVSTRLKPDGKILIIMTRWHEDDLCGRLLGEDWKGQSGPWRTADGRLFRIINLPLLAEHKDDPLGRKLNTIQVGEKTYGEMLWPEYFKEKNAIRYATTANKGGTLARTWASLYQQRPSPNEGAILSKDYWRPWIKEKLPECELIFLAYDTAFEEEEESDESAMTAWGIFRNTSKKTTGEEYLSHRHVILLGAWHEQVQAVHLMRHVKEHCKLFKPDKVLIEKRASGIQLIQEMRRLRFPVHDWLPRGKPGAKGKIPRAHAIAFVLEAGSVWYVPGKKTEKVLDQCAAFPFGTHDDLVDTVTCALAYFRDAWLFQTAYDELDKDERDELALMRTQLHVEERPRGLYNGPGVSNRAEREELDDDFSLFDERPEPRKRRGYGRL